MYIKTATKVVKYADNCLYQGSASHQELVSAAEQVLYTVEEVRSSLSAHLHLLAHGP